LRNLLPADFVLGLWSMLPDDLLYLESYIEGQLTEELVVVELGAGASTIFFSKILARLGKQVTFYSFEAEPEWVGRTQQLLEKYHCRSPSLQLAPYRNYGEYFWFDTDEIHKSLKGLGLSLNILIVDAPPDTLGPFARRPALDVFWRYLGPHSLV